MIGASFATVRKSYAFSCKNHVINKVRLHHRGPFALSVIFLKVLRFNHEFHTLPEHLSMTLYSPVTRHSSLQS